MSTAADVIRRSLKLLGVLAAGESLRAEDQADCLVELNLMLGTWANERLMVYGTRRTTYTLAPTTSPHTIGTGGTFATTRPLRIDGAGVIRMGETAEIPIRLLTDDEYRAIPVKSLQNDIPTQLWVEETHPAASLWFWPVPTSAATLALYTWSRIAEFASSDTVTLPDGYENALGNALALQIAPMYGVEPSSALVQNAIAAIAAIKRTNNQPAFMKCDPAILNRGGAATLLGGGGGTDSGGLY